MFEFGGTGAPAGIDLITGSGSKFALFDPAVIEPTLIGPWMCVVFLTIDIEELGWHQSDPWKTIALSWKAIAPLVFESSEANISIWLLPLLPCQFVVVQFATAHWVSLLPVKVIFPPVSSTPVLV